MAMGRWIVCLLLTVFLWPASSFGQSTELVEAQKQFDQLLEQGLYRKALPIAEKALELGEQEFGKSDPYISILLEKLAAVHEAEMRYDKAQFLYDMIARR